jgi:hypothetical protein
MSKIVGKRRILIIVGLGIVVILAAVPGTNYVSQWLAQQARDAAYLEIVRALDNGNYQEALKLIDEHDQYFSQREAHDLRARAVVGQDIARARATRDALYAKLQAFVEQQNDISAIITAREFLNNLSASDPDPRAQEVEQIKDRSERKLARDDAYSQLASIVTTNADQSLMAAKDFLEKLAPGDVDHRTSEVERIKDVLETKVQEQREIYATLVNAYEQGDYRTTADNARLYISYNSKQIDPALGDMYREALELWAAQAPENDPDLQLHLESYNRWIVQGATETRAWISTELEAAQEQMELGNYDEAIAAYYTVLSIHPALTSSAMRLNNLCWYGGLWGYNSDDLLDICELGVQGALTSPNLANHRDSRGLVRALRGDFEGAIIDFEFYVDVYSAIPDRDQSSVTARREWIEALSQNNNPFTDEVLSKLRHHE